MQESVKVAHGFIRSNAKLFNISEDKSSKYDMHIHFPEGATPKDGPSAGIAITTSMISCLSDKKIRQDIAMTGEITMMGNVLPVGGIKEKVLGANRVGIKEVILPLKNKQDIDEIPVEVIKNTKFHLVDNYKKAFELVFIKEI